jgi:hypothetical protein
MREADDRLPSRLFTGVPYFTALAAMEKIDCLRSIRFCWNQKLSGMPS